MTRLNWNQRQSPTDLDDNPDVKPSLEFDYTHQGGAMPWPEKCQGIKFGPALVKKAWQAGLVVIAYVEGFDHPVAVTETRWNDAKCFEVKTLEGWRLPQRIRTLTDSRGLKSTGEYVES